MGARILKWLFFTVFMSLIPFLLTGLTLWIDPKPGKAFEWSSLWPHGDLLLISTAIAADGLGDMIPTGSWATKSKIVSAGSCVILLFLCALWYAVVQDHPSYPTSKISESSLWLFGLTLVATFVCKLLAEQ
jgi:hypothetical protein